MARTTIQDMIDAGLCTPAQLTYGTNEMLLLNLKNQQTIIEKLCLLVEDADIDPTDVPKCFVETIYAHDNDDTKKTLLPFAVWEHPITKEICIVSFGANPNDDPDAIIPNFQDNYTMNIAGQVIPANLAARTTPECVTICIAAGASITIADALAQAVTEGILLPDGTAPTGVLNPQVMLFQIGQVVKDAGGNMKKSGSQSVQVGADTVNASSTWCPGDQAPIDDDCDLFLQGYDLTTVIENNSATEAAVIRFCADFIPLDADDTDSNVQ